MLNQCKKKYPKFTSNTSKDLKVHKVRTQKKKKTIFRTYPSHMSTKSRRPRMDNFYEIVLRLSSLP